MDKIMITSLRNKFVPSLLVQRDYMCFKNKAEELKAILTDVVLHQGSNSILISGPRCSGKSTLVESVISELSSNCEFESSCHIVRLSGILCTDFMSSLEELSYQLRDEEEFANLLEKETFAEGRTDILIFIREALIASSKAIIIILDHIELFCEHKGQALLYNLFDITRSEEISMCIIGMTPCQEILELFEKRVKSRFSHRIIYIKPLKFEEYQNFLLTMLQLENCSSWNKDMKKLLAENSVIQVHRQLHNSDNSIGALCRFWYNICIHCQSDSELTPQLISGLYEDEYQGVKIKQCLDLNLDELLVVIGIFKVTKSGLPTFTFNNIYETIQKVGEGKGINESDVRVAMKKLEELHIITPVDKTCSYYRAEMDHEELYAVSKHSKLPSEFQGLL